MLKTQCKRVKREGSTTTYVRHLASVVFTNLCHMSEEFLRAFPDSSSCASGNTYFMQQFEINNIFEVSYSEWFGLKVINNPK